MLKFRKLLLYLIIVVLLLFGANVYKPNLPFLSQITTILKETVNSFIYSEIPQNEANIAEYDGLPIYTGDPYVVLGESTLEAPSMDAEGTFVYSELDSLGRCGTNYAIVTPETLIYEERDSIQSIKPTGWHTVRYDDLIGLENQPGYLYNRCHLIMYAMGGANTKENLITGTRYLNVSGMLPIELEVVKYVEKTGVPVTYQVTPVFIGNDLLAQGVEIEALSADGNINLRAYCFNIQPAIEIDYATGDNWRE